MRNKSNLTQTVCNNRFSNRKRNKQIIIYSCAFRAVDSLVDDTSHFKCLCSHLGSSPGDIHLSLHFRLMTLNCRCSSSLSILFAALYSSCFINISDIRTHLRLLSLLIYGFSCVYCKIPQSSKITFAWRFRINHVKISVLWHILII